MAQNDQVANIILRLKDEFSKKLSTAGKDFQNFARSVDQAGAAMARTGMRMTAVGATMTAPFLAATKAMEKYSFDARNEMIRMDNAILSLSQTIAAAAMPAIRELNDNLARIVNILRSIDPAIMQNVARWSLMIGQILLVTGIMTAFIGKVISLTAKFAALGVTMMTFSGAIIPGLIAVTAGLIFAWVKFHDEFVLVIDSLRFLWLQFIDTLMKGWQNFLQMVSRIPGANSFARQVDQLTIARQKLKQEMDAIASGGSSSWTRQLEGWSKQLQKFIDDNYKKIASASTSLETVIRDTKTALLDTANSFADGFSDAFDKVLFEGEKFGNSMKSLFASMGRSIVKDFVSTVGKNLFNALLGGSGTNSGTGLVGSFFGPIGTAIGGFFGSLFKFHEGGMIYAHAGLAPDEVPIIAQTGEGVLSRRGMAAIGGSGALRAINRGDAPSGGNGITVVINQVVRAWDSNDVYRNSKTLTAAIANEIRTNGDLRRAIKET